MTDNELAGCYLSYRELACKDADRTPYPAEWRSDRLPRLARLFASLRETMGARPLRILSAYRTAAHNARQGGSAKHSQHVEGRALDVACPRGESIVDFHAKAREWAAREPLLGGIGYYGWGVHVDVRPRKEAKTAGRLYASWGAPRQVAHRDGREAQA